MVLIGYLCHSDVVEEDIVLRDLSELARYRGYVVWDREAALADDPCAITVYILCNWYEVYGTFQGGATFSYATTSYKDAVEKALQLRRQTDAPHGEVWVLPHYCPKDQKDTTVSYHCDGVTWHRKFPPILTW